MSRIQTIDGITALPPECIFAICRHLDSRSLATAAQVSPLHHAATHTLYKNDVEEWQGISDGLFHGVLHNLERPVRAVLTFRPDINWPRPYYIGQHRENNRTPIDRAGTALHIAAGEGHSNIVRLLIGGGAEVDAYSARFPGQPNGVEKGTWLEIPFENYPGGYLSPLFAAIAAGHQDTSMLLITSGASLVVEKDTREPEEKLAHMGQVTALHVAARAGNRYLIDVLMDEHDLDVNQPDSEGHTPLHWAVSSCRGTQYIDHLVFRGADVKATAYGEIGVLHSAVELEDDDQAVGAIKILLDLGADIDINPGATALDYAIEQYRPKLAEALVNGGARVDVAVLERLLEEYESTNETGEHVKSNMKACVKIILEHFAEEDLGEVMLDCITQSYVDSARILFDCGVRLYNLDEDGINGLVLEMVTGVMFMAPGFYYLVDNFDALTDGRLRDLFFQLVLAHPKSGKELRARS